jgi:hypothetical protein
MSLIRYLFPKRRPQTRLPLLPLHYSSDHCPYGPLPPEARREADRLKMHSCARTDADAWRLMQGHQRPVEVIIQREKRQHRFMNRWRRAWKRFKRIW